MHLRHPYAWLFCGFAALGAWLYGYDGVYFTGVTALDVFARNFGTRLPDGTYTIEPGALSLMTSMINVGELVGTLSSAFFNDRLGRKGSWLVGATFLSIGVVLQLVTNSNRNFISGGRAIMGFGVGVFCATSPLYIAEVAPTEVRGPLLSFWQLTLSASQIMAAAINRGISTNETTFAWRFPTGFQLLFPFFVFSMIWFVPESPRWLVRKDRVANAERSLRCVHREKKNYNPENDIQRIKMSIQEERDRLGQGSWSSLIKDAVERRKVLYSAGALIAQQINGIQWFYYFGTVFSKAIGLTDPFLMTLIVFVIQLFVVFAALLLSNRIPRRPLMLTCTCIMMFSIFIVGCMGIHSDGKYVAPVYGKVIISFVIIEIVAFNFSWGPLGWVIASEMAVGPNRNKIYAIAVGCFWISVWVTVFTLPYLYYSANLGPKTGFIYTGLCGISLSYVYFCVGEVSGRSMEEIEEFFQKGIPATEWKNQPQRQNPREDLEKAGKESGVRTKEKHEGAAEEVELS